MGTMLDLFKKGTYCDTPYHNFFEVPTTTIYNKEIQLSEYKEKAILVVNASPTLINSSISTKNIEYLNQLKENFPELEIFIYPTNSLDKSELKRGEILEKFTNAGINQDIKLFKKISVSGSDTCETYKFLMKNSPLFQFREGKARDIKSDFTAFLVNKNGQVKHYSEQLNDELNSHINIVLEEKPKKVLVRNYFMKLGKFI